MDVRNYYETRIGSFQKVRSLQEFNMQPHSARVCHMVLNLRNVSNLGNSMSCTDILSHICISMGAEHAWAWC